GKPSNFVNFKVFDLNAAEVRQNNRPFRKLAIVRISLVGYADYTCTAIQKRLANASTAKPLRSSLLGSNRLLAYVESNSRTVREIFYGLVNRTKGFIVITYRKDLDVLDAIVTSENRQHSITVTLPFL